jgi:hypothetical protein
MRASYPDRVQGLLSQSHLRAVGAFEVEPQRQTMAVSDQHPLGALAFLSESHLLTSALRGHERPIEEGHGPVELAAQIKRAQCCAPDTFPDARFTPAFESAPDRGRRAVLARQIPPTTPRDEDVENALDRPAVVGSWSSGPGRKGKHGLDETPWRVSQMYTGHAAMLRHLLSVSKPLLYFVSAHVRMNLRDVCMGVTIPAKVNLELVLVDFEFIA